MDYHQNDTERKIFYESHEIPVAFGDVAVDEASVLTGVFDNEDEKLGVMLGVWKPIQPDQVSYFKERSYEKIYLRLFRFVIYHLQSWMQELLSLEIKFCIMSTLISYS